MIPYQLLLCPFQLLISLTISVSWVPNLSKEATSPEHTVHNLVNYLDSLINRRGGGGVRNLAFTISRALSTFEPSSSVTLEPRVE